MAQVLAQRVLTATPRPMECRHAAELGQHGALIRAKLIHGVLLGSPLLLRRDHQAWVVLVQVWRPSLHLGGNVMGGGLRLHTGGGAGVWRLGLRSGRRLRGSNLVSEGGGQSLALQVRVGGGGHLLGLLGAHGVTVLGWGPPWAQMLLLLLEQPLVKCLLEQSLRGLWGATLRGLRALGGLLRTRTRLPPWQTRHGILLLHLQVVLVSLLESLLLGHRAGVTLTLLRLL